MDIIIYLEVFNKLINDNGGFTVVGWYKIGVSNNTSLIASRKVSNGNGGNTSKK